MPLPVSTICTRVRRAKPADLDQLLALEQRSFVSDRLSRAQYRRHLDSASAAVLVASDGQDNLLGAAVVFFRKHSGVSRLYSLASHPEARGKGVGTTLLEAAAATARQRDCHVMRLEVRIDNPAAIRLYERAGYRPIGRYTRYYADGVDALRYEKPLV